MASPHVPKTGVIERARCFFENTKTGKEVVLPKSPAAPAANAVTLVTAADENFVPHLAALLESIKASFNPDRFLDLIVLDGGIPPLKRNLLRRQFHMGLPASKGSLTFLDCQHMYRGISTHMHFSPATFYRLSLGQLLQNHTRALYIDCDTIVLADLCRLWDTPLNGAVIGATPDLIMKNFVKAGIRSMEETGACPPASI
nr:glycosyltransferase [Acetobacter persici]